MKLALWKKYFFPLFCTCTVNSLIFFFYLGFLFRKFTVHRVAWEEESYLFNLSLPFPRASIHLDISWAIPTVCSRLHIACRGNRTGNIWFPNASCKPLSYTPWITWRFPEWLSSSWTAMVAQENISQKIDNWRSRNDLTNNLHQLRKAYLINTADICSYEWDCSIFNSVRFKH